MDRALIIKKKWLDLILSGQKTWEIRSNNTKIRGKIGLIESGTGLIVGECEVIDSKKFYVKNWRPTLHEHQIFFDMNENIDFWLKYNRLKNAYAWVLKNAKRYDKPIPYNHPQGAVVWVKI